MLVRETSIRQGGDLMTVTDVQLDNSNITLFLAGEMSLGSAPVISLLIRRSQRLGLSVHLNVSGITDVDEGLNSYLSGWQVQGVTLTGSHHLALSADHDGVRSHTSRSG